MRSVFISYSRADQDQVGELFGDLQGLGHNAWMDKELSGGMEWWKEILRRIREADVFVYVASAASISSQACQRELKYALALGKPILPVRTADGPRVESLPAAIQALQLLDYRTADKAVVFALAKALAEIPKSPRLPDPLPPEPALPASYLVALRELAETEGALPFESQTALLVKLREKLKEEDERPDVVDILQGFRKRHDLLAIVAEEIDEILAAEAKKTGSPPRRTVISGGEGPWLLVAEKRFLIPRLTRGQLVGYTGEIVLLAVVFVTSFFYIFNGVSGRYSGPFFDLINDYVPTIASIIGTLLTYLFFYIESRRADFSTGLFSRRPTLAQAAGHFAVVVVLALIFIQPTFPVVYHVFERLGIYDEALPVVLTSIVFTCLVSTLFFAANGVRFPQRSTGA
jgi:hypothetical protein